jgi:phosphoglycolate phosphatase
MNLKTIIYDFDGTIVDTAPVTVSLLNQLRKGMGKTPIRIDKHIHLLSLGGKDLIKHFLETDDWEEIEFYLEKFRSLSGALPGDVSPLYPNIKETLSMLKKNNKVIGICSNKPKNLIEKIISSFEIDKYFDFVLGGEDLVTKKPNPINLRYCIEKLKGNRETSLFVGDSTVDQKTSLNANVKFAFFSQGYNDGVDISNIDFSFEDHAELAEFILNDQD